MGTLTFWPDVSGVDIAAPRQTFALFSGGHDSLCSTFLASQRERFMREGGYIPDPATAECCCPAGTYNPGNVHEAYCPLSSPPTSAADDGSPSSPGSVPDLSGAACPG